ncbi:MAG: nucleoside triphosphate pyrophosphohydrolase [Patescibacteria group bacterium]|mgnify:FL=1
MSKEIIYNKLIRDRIPEITQADGWLSKTKILNKPEFLKELKKKILEEVNELNQSHNRKDIISELVDIQELIDNILKETKIKFQAFRQIQAQKRKKRGGFEKKLFLIKTIKS